jgi:hypothetical protein
MLNLLKIINKTMTAIVFRIFALYNLKNILVNQAGLFNFM